MIKWPEAKQDLKIQDDYRDWAEQSNIDGWNACLEACKKAYEQESKRICDNCGKWTECVCVEQEYDELETPNDIAFQKGFAAGVNATGQKRVPLNEELLSKHLMKDPNMGIIECRRIAIIINLKFGQQKP